MSVPFYQLNNENYEFITASPQNKHIRRANQRFHKLPYVRCHRLLDYESPNRIIIDNEKRRSVSPKILRQSTFLVNSTKIVRSSIKSSREQDNRNNNKNYIPSFTVSPTYSKDSPVVQKSNSVKQNKGFEFQNYNQSTKLKKRNAKKGERQKRRLQLQIRQQNQLLKMYQKEIKRSQKNCYQMQNMISQTKKKPKASSNQLVLFTFMLIMMCQYL